MDNILEFIIQGKGAKLEITLNEPLILKNDAYIGLKSFCFYNSMPNVSKNKNNSILLKVPGHAGYFPVNLETGAYELSSIYRTFLEEIQIKYPELKDVDDHFRLEGNEATMKCEFVFTQDYGVNFDTPNSIAKILGFSPKAKHSGPGKYIGDTLVNITNVTNVVFNSNISEPNFINNRQVPFLFNCNIDVSNGFRLSREINNIQYKKLNTSQISVIRVWLTDQQGHTLNLQNETVVVTLSLKQYDSKET